MISPDGRTVLLNDHKLVRRIDLPEGTGHIGPVYAVAVSQVEG